MKAMINKIHILLMAVVLASACSNLDIGYLNPWNSDPGEDDTPIVFLRETEPGHLADAQSERAGGGEARRQRPWGSPSFITR